MGWLKDFFSGSGLDNEEARYVNPARPYLDRPNDLEAYPDEYPYNFRSNLRPIPQIVSQSLAKEASVLSQLGFPIPKATTQLRFEPVMKPAPSWANEREWLNDVVVHLPHFDIPECLDVRVRNNLHYVITGSQEHFQAAKTALAKHGLTYLIEHYPGRWFNRHPYGFHIKVNANKPECYLAFGRDWFGPFCFSIGGTLEEVFGLNADAIRKIEQRIKILETLSQKRSSFVGELIKYTPDPERSIYNDYIGDKVIFDNSLIPDDVFSTDYISFKVLPSKEVTTGVTEQWLESLRLICKTACFELKNEPGTLYYQFTVTKQDAPAVEQNFRLYFPDFVLSPQELPTHQPAPNRIYVTISPSLSHEFIKTLRDFTLDPYLQLFGLFDRQKHDEGLQIFFAPLQAESIRSVLWVSSGEEIKQGIEKKQTPWVMALTFYTDDQTRLDQFRQSFLAQFETAQQKWQLSPAQPTATDDFAIPPWNLVSTSELVSFVHFPSREIQSERLETANMKSKLPPESYTTGPVVIGETEARGSRKPVTLPSHARDRHVYIVGKSGMGKSTLITNAVIANMNAGEGACVIDPHGDLVATGAQPLLDYVPEQRIRDTIYFNAADKEYPLALNMLSAGKDEELSLLADNLLVMFRRQSDGWGPRMEDILRATLQTLMHTPGSSFLDIKRLLHNEAFRLSVVRRLTHPMLKEFWEEDYPVNYSRKEATAPIISRVNKLLYLPQLYAMLSSTEGKLDFYDIIQSKKILLVNLSSGTIGEDNAQLLGSLLVTQLQMAAMRRAGVPPAQRHAFYLYVDEFQNFTTASFEKILSEARKYRLCLTLAHQFISQIPDTQRDAIFGNVGSMIMFSCGDKDANALRYQLGSYEPQDLVNLKKFEALLRPESAKDTFPFKTVPPLYNPEGLAESVIEHTRMTYASIIDPDIQPGEPEQPVAPTSSVLARPALALDKKFATKGDELLYYIRQAEYLNTDQLKQLCYGHLTERARAPAVSRDLKKLIDANRLKSEPFGRGNIYFAGRTPKPTSHNLEVRNLLVKIIRSGFEIAEVTFCPALPSLVSDLAVSFLAADGGQIKTLWEYDAGTEGMAELMKKVARYAFLKDEAAITFVFNARSRLEQVNRSISDGFIRLAVLEEIGTLHDPVFQYASGGSPHPFF